MIGTQAKLLDQYSELFTEDEKIIIFNHIDSGYTKLMQKSYMSEGNLTWNYFESSKSSQNDAIHHGFILEGIYDYQKYRIKEDPLSDKNYTSYIDKCIKDNIIYSTPKYSSHRCFNTDTIRWVSDREVQKEILIKSYDLYVNSDTVKRQLAFLLNAFSMYLSES